VAGRTFVSNAGGRKDLPALWSTDERNYWCACRKTPGGNFPATCGPMRDLERGKPIASSACFKRCLKSPFAKKTLPWASSPRNLVRRERVMHRNVHDVAVSKRKQPATGHVNSPSGFWVGKCRIAEGGFNGQVGGGKLGAANFRVRHGIQCHNGDSQTPASPQRPHGSALLTSPNRHAGHQIGISINPSWQRTFFCLMSLGGGTRLFVCNETHFKPRFFSCIKTLSAQFTYPRRRSWHR